MMMVKVREWTRSDDELSTGISLILTALRCDADTQLSELLSVLLVLIVFIPMVTICLTKVCLFLPQVR